MRSYDLEKEFLHKDNCGKGIIYNQQDGKFDVTIEQNSSDITEHLLKVTWQELVDLKAQSLLQPGVFYRITDYEFTSTDPEIINAGHRFDIIVLALSEDILSEDARAIQHEFTEEEKEIYSEEEQHYFDKSNLSAWRLKYSLDGDSKRFAWAPANKDCGINIYSNVGNQTLYRNTNKDEGIYYAFSNDNYTYYTTSEEPVEGDQLYENKDGQIKEVFRYDVWYNAKQILIKSDYSESYYNAYLDENDNYIKASSDSYTIYSYTSDGLNMIYHNMSEYIVIDETYSYINEDGVTKTGILVTPRYYSNTWLHNGNRFSINFPITFTDYIISETESYTFSESYTFTLSKLPEIGDTIEFELGGASYVPFTNVSLSNKNINNQITYVKDYTKVISIIPKNTSYRGIIYGMVDEFENDCEYDFKNALITGRYSLFDPDQFYYTFTNQGSTPSLLKSGDEPILLYPGTYSFLGCMPFRYYEDNPYEFYLKVQGKTQEYSEWDLYAAICDTEGYIDEDTGERHYKVNMYAKYDYTNPTSNDSHNFGHNQMIKIFEDRQWYIKDLPPETNYYNWSTVIYCNYNGFTEEFNGRLYTTQEQSKYFHHYKGWVYDCAFKNSRVVINLNNIGSTYYSVGSDFNINTDSDTYASDFGFGNSCVYFVTDNNGSYGIHCGSSQYYNNYITWIKQWLPTTLNPSSDSYSQVYETNTKYKFTKPITITEPMYVYLSPYNTTAQYADAYILGDVMLSPKKIIELGDTGYDLYCTNRDYSELNGDLYSWSFNIVNPKDTSCAYSYYGPDCYRVTLRTSYFGGGGKQIPKVIMDDVQSSTIEAQGVFLQDCYCIKARNGGDGGYPYGNTFGNYWSNDNKLFLRKVYFSELQDVDYTTIEDCYCINITRVKDSHIRNYCQALKANDCTRIILDSVAESTVEHCNDIQVYHVWGSHLFKCFNDRNGPSMNTIRDLTDSILYSIQNCNINANGECSWCDNGYSKIYINGLKYKEIELTNYLSYDDRGSNPYRCVHIRSEDDLTITV